MTTAALHPLCAIVDVDVASASGWSPVDLAAAYLHGGARFLQIRAKQLASGPFLELCDEIVGLGRAAGALIVVNDRADLARLSGAGGLHVGQDDLPPRAARSLVGEASVIGLSTHSVAQAEAALAEPADYTAVGPVFGTSTKDTGYSAVGLELVRAVAAMPGARPVVAIGGVTVANAPSVLAAGGASVAVIGDLLRGDSPEARVREYLRALR